MEVLRTLLGELGESSWKIRENEKKLLRKGINAILKVQGDLTIKNKITIGVL